jgi:hypothetical protein
LIRVIACGFAVLILAAPARAQDTRPPGTSVRVRPGRLLGVFDYDTWEPIEGARVLDLLTGWSAVTTSTGTLSLFFVDTAGSFLQVAKLGYATQRFVVGSATIDTAGITIMLKANAQMLPTVVTRGKRGRGPADTVQLLERSGFYDRRQTSGTPLSAFVTSEKIAKLTLMADITRLSGRQICATNLYINGIKVDPPSLRSAMPGSGAMVVVAAPLRNYLDALVTPGEVLGIELYRSSDVPARFNPGRGGGCGATLVWTK